MAAHTRTKEQRLIDRREMTELLRMGWLKQDIAHKFGVHPTQITYDWKACVKDIQQSMNEDTSSRIIITLAQYSKIKIEAWAAWMKSKEDAQKIIEESIEGKPCIVCSSTGNDIRGKPCFHCNGTGVRESPKRITNQREGRNPANEYLRTILSCLEAERELLALNPPKEHRLKAQVQQTNLNWDLLAQGIPDGPVPDVIEAEIAKAMLEMDKTTPSVASPEDEVARLELELEELKRKNGVK